MEQMEEEPPPFWLQSTAALRRADRRRRRQHRASSLFLNTGVLVVLLLAAAVVFLAIVIPSVLSLARQVFNPSLVKKSWNSVNLILVLFAIVCGFLGKKDDDQTPTSSPVKREATVKSYEYNQGSSRMSGYSSFGNAADSMRLRRNSSSYPDLRQDGRWEMNENNRWRFYDDTDVNTTNNHQFMRSESQISRSKSMGVIDENEIDVRNIEVDTGAKEVAPPSTSPPPPSRPHKALRKSDYVRSRDGDEDQYVIKNIEVDTSASNQPKGLKSQSSNPPLVNRPIPPPPPPLPTYSYSHQPLSPPSPISPTNYYWPPASPPPPPPPPPRARPSISSKKKNEYKGNPPTWESISQYYEIQKPPPSPPPPPPPRREQSSTLPKKKHEYKRDWNDPTRESRSTYVIQKPLPPLDFLQPSSPPSPTNYFWPSPPPPPPPPPPPMPTYSSTLPKRKQEDKRNSPIKRESRSKAQIQTPPPPPPPPPPPQSQPIVENILEAAINRKKGIVIRTLNRIPRRKRKQGRRSYENLDEFMEPPKTSIHRSKSTPEFPPSSPPPPPPPPSPPPPSMFHNIFSKKGKTKKKVHSTSTSGPPAPPPPPSRPLPKTKRKPPATRRPLPPAKTDSFNGIDENIGNGSESPLIPIPPPPPPPPFKMPPWRYVMQGDYVKLESFSNSPRSGYSASEDDESSPSNQKTNMASSSSSSVFCPSPDVNTKADDFITRFREKLTLEKNNSIKRQQGTGPSQLGSNSSPP